MKRRISILSLLFPCFVYAHHGVASLGAAGLEGPGAPLETSSSATLPEGKWLLYGKLDFVKWKKYSWSDFPDQKDEYHFWTYGLGYGLKSYLSLYMFIPYYTKKEIKSKTPDNPSSGFYDFTSSGFADVSFMSVLGYKYDGGFKLVPKKESLDDMTDWRFTTYFGFSLPTGDYRESSVDKVRNDFSPDMSTGFGKPSLMVGQTVTKQLVNIPQITVLFDANYTKFFEKSYNYKNGDGSNKRYKYGDEIRVNTALVYRVFTEPEKKLRFDTLIEGNFQQNQRDREDGVKAQASGGKFIYGTVGGRVYYQNLSVGLGIKVPLWKSLNEESLQQGGEGKEKYRLIITFSGLF